MGESYMEYILKLFDVELMKFRIIENLADPVLQITWINEKKKKLLPLGMELKEKLRKMLTYNLQKVGAYNYSSDRLKLISKMVQERVHEILN